jgi:hypothetical protein
MTGKSIKKFSAAMDAMRKPDTRLLQTNCDGRPTFWIAPGGGRVEPEIGRELSIIRRLSAARMCCYQDIIRRGGCARVIARLKMMRPTKRGGNAALAVNRE